MCLNRSQKDISFFLNPAITLAFFRSCLSRHPISFTYQIIVIIALQRKVPQSRICFIHSNVKDRVCRFQQVWWISKDNRALSQHVLGNWQPTQVVAGMIKVTPLARLIAQTPICLLSTVQDVLLFFCLFFVLFFGSNDSTVLFLSETVLQLKNAQQGNGGLSLEDQWKLLEKPEACHDILSDWETSTPTSDARSTSLLLAQFAAADYKYNKSVRSNLPRWPRVLFIFLEKKRRLEPCHATITHILYPATTPTEPDGIPALKQNNTIARFQPS